MKRIIVILWGVLAVILSGCSGKTAPVLSESDMLLNINGSAYHCRDNIQTVIANLGAGYEYAEGKSCDYDGLDKTYTYQIATFYTNPLPQGDMLNEIYSQSGSVTTSRDITVGAKRSDVISAYGEPVQQDELLLVYRVSQEIGAPALCFQLEGEVVTAIFLTLEQV